MSSDQLVKLTTSFILLCKKSKAYHSEEGLKKCDASIH